MSTQLQTAVNEAGPQTVAQVRELLSSAVDVARTDNDPHAALLYLALCGDLDHPARTYRQKLVAAATTAGEDATNGSSTPSPAQATHSPAYALARELGTVARMTRDMEAAFAQELNWSEGAARGNRMRGAARHAHQPRTWASAYPPARQARQW